MIPTWVIALLISPLTVLHDPHPGTHPAPGISPGVRRIALAWCTCARSVRSGVLQLEASVEWLKQKIILSSGMPSEITAISRYS